MSLFGRVKCACVASMVAVMASMVFVSEAVALEPGSYDAVLTPSYANPDTGEIEDAGGESSSALGESMVQGIASADAFVVVEDDAASAVLSFGQADSLGDVLVACDDSKSGAFGDDATAQLVATDADENRTTYACAITSPEATLRFRVYVEPMGREVTFFATLGQFSLREQNSQENAEREDGESVPAGNRPRASEPSTDAQPAADSDQPKAAQTAADGNSSEAAQTPTDTQQSKDSQQSPEGQSSDGVPSSAGDGSGAEDLLEGQTVPSGVRVFTADGNEVTGAASDVRAADQLNYPLILGVGAIGCVVLAFVLWLSFVRPRRKRQARAAQAAQASQSARNWERM